LIDNEGTGQIAILSPDEIAVSISVTTREELELRPQLRAKQTVIRPDRSRCIREGLCGDGDFADNLDAGGLYVPNVRVSRSKYVSLRSGSFGSTRGESSFSDEVIQE